MAVPAAHGRPRTIHSQARLAPSVSAARALAGILQYNGDPAAALARSYVADLLTVNADDGALWDQFLYADPTLPTQPYSATSLSYFAEGPGTSRCAPRGRRTACGGRSSPVPISMPPIRRTG